ncbi:MAG: Trp family transcriptional regulator [Kiritimatiellia bacterium]
MRKESQVCAFQQFEKEWAELSSVLASLDKKEEVAQFLGEICTTKECVDFAKRWALMKELLSGVPQRTIARKLQTSLCKITRGVQYCKSGESILRRCAEECIRHTDGK